MERAPVVLAVACFVIANEVGIVELMYFGILLLAVLGASVASLYLTRRSDTVTRSLSPDVATVGRDSLVTVRVGVRTALPTAPGTWRDTVPEGSVGEGERGVPRARLGTARRRARRAALLRRHGRAARHPPDRPPAGAPRPTRSAWRAARRCSASARR